MVNLIDYTYFVDELQIANCFTDADVQTWLNASIARKQYEFLNKLLGPDIYLEFVTWYNINPADTTNTFYKLLNGDVFTFNGFSYNWVGLVNAQKMSPLANYVYYFYQRNNATQTTSPGEAKTNSQNATASSGYNKQKQAWDKMAEWVRVFEFFMNNYYNTPIDFGYYWYWPLYRRYENHRRELTQVIFP